MFMMSVRLSRRRMLFGGLALVLVLAIGVIGFRALNSDNAVAAVNPEKEKETAVKSVEIKKAKAKTNEQRVAFAQAFGWEVKLDATEVMEVVIPQNFDEVYSQYNSIQKMQGCDLEPLSGKRCKRYSYEIINYPGEAEDVRINILVYKNKVVGGDVCSLRLGGFMHGFEPPAN